MSPHDYPFRFLAIRRPAPGPLQRLPLAGFRHHHGQRLWSRLRPGQALTLVREPDNPHDPKAVRIDWRGHKLGYLPRRDNAAVARMLDRGATLEGRIKVLRIQGPPQQRVEVEISG